ncbi:hypothetical protein LCGC14_0990610 [marine sediment metagenome]|uniref:Uncharacterized protein n=1 Tax=marine sediment metagenome TaxID=412755 RepID=A0A0F9QPB2_9ZZZZ
MKAFNYSIMILGMLLLLEMGGIDVGTNLLSLVGIDATTFSFSTSNFFNAIFGATGILLIAGIAAGLLVGFLTKTSPENYIILPFITTVLVVFLQGFYGIINYSFANNPIWISQLILLILAPLTVGYAFSLVEFFRGTD